VSLGVVGALASGRVLFASSLFLALAALVLVEGVYDVRFVRVGSMAAGLGVSGAYDVGLAGALAALVAVAVLFGSRETVLAFRFYSGGFAGCSLGVLLGSALFGAGFFVFLLVVLVAGSGDLRGSGLVVAAGFLDYLVLALFFYGLSAGVSEARLLGALAVFARAITPPLREAWFAYPELAAYYYYSGGVGGGLFAGYLAAYAVAGLLACRLLAWRG